MVLLVTFLAAWPLSVVQVAATDQFLRDVNGGLPEHALTATNPGMASVSNDATSTSAADSLQITKQPASVVVQLGSVATLSVEAASDWPLRYQWHYRSVDVLSGVVGPLVPLAGATNAALIFAPVTRAEAAKYQVAVMNKMATVFSQEITLEVTPAGNFFEFIRIELPFNDWVKMQPIIPTEDGDWLLAPNYTWVGWSLKGVAELQFRVNVFSTRKPGRNWLSPFVTVPIATRQMTYPTLPVAVASDHKTIAVGMRDGTVQLHSIDQYTNLEIFTNNVPTQIATLSFTPHASSALAFSPDGTLLGVGTEEGELVLWDLKTRTVVQTLTWSTPTRTVLSLAFAPAQNYLAADCGHRLVLWLWPDGVAQQPDPDWDPKGWVGFSPSGALLATRSDVRSTDNWEVQYRFDSDAKEFPLVFSHDGRMLLFGGPQGAQLLWVDHELRLRFLPGYRYWGNNTFLAFSSDDKQLITNVTLTGNDPELLLNVEAAPDPLTLSWTVSNQPLPLHISGGLNWGLRLQVSTDLHEWRDWTNGARSAPNDVYPIPLPSAPAALFFRGRTD